MLLLAVLAVILTPALLAAFLMAMERLERTALRVPEVPGHKP